MSRTAWPVHVLLMGASAVTVFPLLWMLTTAWKSPPEIFTQGVHLWPAHPTLANFGAALRDVPIVRLFANSLAVATAVALAQVTSSVLAAYAFARFTFRGSDLLFYAVVATMLVPFQVIMIPNYLLVSGLHWINTYQGLIVPQVASGFGVFLLRQHFKTFPASYLEAARMDGATSWQALWHVLVPPNAGTIWSLGILLFITAWNEYLWPLLVATDKQMQTLPVGIQAFVNLEGGTQWGPLMAAAALAAVPALLLYAAAQRYVVESAAGAGLRG